MAAKSKEVLSARPEKSPELPGEVMYRAKIIHSETGEVIRVLGSKTYDEDEVTERGHAAIDAEVMERAIAARAKKEEKS